MRACVGASSCVCACLPACVCVRLRVSACVGVRAWARVCVRDELRNFVMYIVQYCKVCECRCGNVSTVVFQGVCLSVSLFVPDLVLAS